MFQALNLFISTIKLGIWTKWSNIDLLWPIEELQVLPPEHGPHFSDLKSAFVADETEQFYLFTQLLQNPIILYFQNKFHAENYAIHNKV